MSHPEEISQVPVTVLKGIGQQQAEKLSRLGIDTIQDILFHLPLRYMDRTRITPIGAMQPNSNVVVEGEVRGASIVFGRRRSLVVKLQDGTGTTTLRFFHFNSAQKEQFKTGRLLRCFGEVRPGSTGLELYHPEYEVNPQAVPAQRSVLTPIYPVTEGLTQQRMRQIAKLALEWLAQREPPELLPQTLRMGQQSLTLGALLRYLHEPPANADIQRLSEGSHPYQQRLIYEELLAHQLSLQKLRANLRARPAPALPTQTSPLEIQLIAQLPFQLTSAQQRVLQEILADLTQSTPMLRLLQGDVGSGKTIVAALTALRVMAAGYQVAFMAPTEILAEQHFENLQRWLEPLGIHCVKLTGKTRGKAREAITQMLQTGQAPLVVGTHALFQEEVEFQRLALVIIDEQHRFGVDQRLALQAKGSVDHGIPHQLIMTATPIPRTLAMSHYSHLDTSVIDQLPPGRKPIITSIINELRRSDVVERIREQCRAGHQVYWVCTLIEESETLECQAAEATANELRLLLPEIQIGLIHGRLKPQEKTVVMSAFKAGEIQLLVATTVIEVGVDVPNANYMIIENPERLGLAQLHQLRGRIGRGQAEAHCILLYHAPLSAAGQERLAAMRRTQNGFEIAEIDLRLRGPGEILGARQAGEIGFHLVNLERDSHLLEPARRGALELLLHHPEVVDPIIRRWIPRSERYSQA